MITKTLFALIISFEGFHPVAYWDHSQWTNGYGTQASYAQEKVSESEAKKRLEEARKAGMDSDDQMDLPFERGL